MPSAKLRSANNLPFFYVFAVTRPVHNQLDNRPILKKVYLIVIEVRMSFCDILYLIAWLSMACSPQQLRRGDRDFVYMHADGCEKAQLKAIPSKYTRIFTSVLPHATACLSLLL